MGSGKTIPGGERTVILRVLHFFEEEKRTGIVIPINQALKRTSAATGVSIGTLTRIKREEKKILKMMQGTQNSSLSEPTSDSEQSSVPTSSADPLSIPTSSSDPHSSPKSTTQDAEQAAPSSQATSSQATSSQTTSSQATPSSKAKPSSQFTPRPVVILPTPGKKRKPAHNKLIIDDCTIGALRNIIDRMHTNREVPSLKKILAAAQEELNFPGQKETLRKILREKLGYTFPKCEKAKKKDLFIDRPEIAALNALVTIVGD